MQRSFLHLVSRCRRAGAALLACLPLSAAAPAVAAEDVRAGPVPAVVEEVVDGDTLRVRALIWLDQEVATYVRLAGVDAPEVRGACPRERELARRAKTFVAGSLQLGQDGRAGVSLRDVRYGKYARRIVARVETAAGLDLGAALLAAGLAQPYDGGLRPHWCD